MSNKRSLPTGMQPESEPLTWWQLLRKDILLKKTRYSAIKRNETGLFVELWMDLETVIQSEVSQKEKNKYRTLTYVCGI